MDKKFDLTRAKAVARAATGKKKKVEFSQRKLQNDTAPDVLRALCSEAELEVKDNNLAMANALVQLQEEGTDLNTLKESSKIGKKEKKEEEEKKEEKKE